MPHSTDREYGARAIPQYERAIALAGGQALRIPLDLKPVDIRKLAQICDAVLLPGSKADVDPMKFRQTRSPHTAAQDTLREETDFLLLEDAFAGRKPILCICYGLQSLNVFRGGSLVQHIPDFLPEETRAKVNHEAGRKVAIAHKVDIVRDSKLGSIVVSETDREGHGFSRAEDGSETSGALAPEARLILPVNSSHHQSAHAIGDGLRIVARCPDDGIIEALEGTSPDHFVVAVQWHPERSVDDDEPSRAIFRALIKAAGSLG
jgi:putative glutamine amidotransferase